MSERKYMHTHPFQLKACRRCGQPVLDGATDGFDLKADPHALTPAGELAALEQGRVTFTVHIHQRQVSLTSRAAWDMGRRDRPIVARHVCGRQPLDHDTAQSLIFIDLLIPPAKEPATCPF